MSTKQKETLSIEGMGCDHCVRAVREALTALPSVEVQAVEIGSATIARDPDEVSRERIARALADEGYTLA